MKYTVTQYSEALAAAFADAAADKRPQLIRRFLHLLQKNRDAKLLAAIIRKTERRWFGDQNLHKVAVASASPLTLAVKKEIEAALDSPPHLLTECPYPPCTYPKGRCGGKKPVWEETIDPSLLGGIRILIDDETLIDASARRRLDRMFSV